MGEAEFKANGMAAVMAQMDGLLLAAAVMISPNTAEKLSSDAFFAIPFSKLKGPDE